MMTALQPVVSLPPALPMLAPEPLSRRDQLWADCRNSLGIARLLVHEGRPEPMVATACRLAVESACRAVLEHLGLRYEGDLERALRSLKMEAEWTVSTTPGTDIRSVVLAAERTVGGIAAFLREAEPSRSWGF